LKPNGRGLTGGCGTFCLPWKRHRDRERERERERERWREKRKTERERETDWDRRYGREATWIGRSIDKEGCAEKGRMKGGGREGLGVRVLGFRVGVEGDWRQYYVVCLGGRAESVSRQDVF